MQVTKYWQRYMTMYVRTSNKYLLNNYRTTCLNKYMNIIANTTEELSETNLHHNNHL